MFHRQIPIMVMRFSLLTSLLALWIVGPAPRSAMALELGLGFSAVDEGDDRPKPGISLQVGVNDDYQGRIHYFGQSFGPISTDTFIVAAAKRFTLFKSEQLIGGVGLAAMNERITLDFLPEDEVSRGSMRDHTEDNYNLGLAFSVGWQLAKAHYPLYLAVSWDSYVFPAGFEGGIFLSSGRKQVLSVTFGLGV